MSSDKEKMVLGTDAFNCGIQKSLVHPGTHPIDYVNGTKVFFHFKTIIQQDGTVLDDSKKYKEDKPMELIIGKKFKLEVWEKALKTMWLNEVAKFSVIKDLLFDYPIVAKQLREFYQPDDSSHKHNHNEQRQRKHCCGHNMMEHGVGYDDLDALLKNPKNLDFYFELIRIEQPGEYKKESWALTDSEKLEAIPILKQDGNLLVKKKMYKEAADKYREALSYLEGFLLKEKPNDEEWNLINEKKLPILSNYSLCEFHLKEFHSCIKHTTEVLEFQPENSKALFRRGKSHLAVWNVTEAKDDMEKCRQIDPSFEEDVRAQLNFLNQSINKKEKEEREKFKGKLFA